MPAKRPRIRKDGLRDNRSRPRLKECPSHEQKYILRRITKKGLGKIVWRGGEGHKPSHKEIRHLLAKKKWFKTTYVLMSTRPRPKHILTCWWEADKDRGKWVFQYREGSQ